MPGTHGPCCRWPPPASSRRSSGTRRRRWRRFPWRRSRSCRLCTRRRVLAISGRRPRWRVPRVPTQLCRLARPWTLGIRTHRLYRRTTRGRVSIRRRRRTPPRRRGRRRRWPRVASRATTRGPSRRRTGPHGSTRAARRAARYRPWRRTSRDGRAGCTRQSPARRRPRARPARATRAGCRQLRHPQPRNTPVHPVRRARYARRSRRPTHHPAAMRSSRGIGCRPSACAPRASVWTPRTLPHPYRTSREWKYFQTSHCVEQAPTRPRWIRRHDTLVREEDNDAARGGSLARLAASRGETRGDTHPASGTQAAARIILLLLQELLPLQEDPRPSVAQPRPPPSPGDGSNAAEGCAGADALTVIRGVEDSGVAAVPQRSVRGDTHTAE